MPNLIFTLNSYKQSNTTPQFYQMLETWKLRVPLKSTLLQYCFEHK